MQNSLRVQIKAKALTLPLFTTERVREADDTKVAQRFIAGIERSKTKQSAKRTTERRTYRATLLREQPGPLHIQHEGKVSLHRFGTGTAPLALHWRNRQGKWNESAGDWRHDGSRSYPPIATRNAERGESNSIDKRRIIEMDSRSISQVSEVRVARRVRRVQRQRFTSQERRQLHRRSEGAPSEEDLRRRILGVS